MIDLKKKKSNKVNDIATKEIYSCWIKIPLPHRKNTVLGL